MWGLALLIPIFLYALVFGMRDRARTDAAVEAQLGMIMIEEALEAQGHTVISTTAEWIE
jgi:hypothetical protein